jgi:dolichol-phosphate mannosyltransferase
MLSIVIPVLNEDKNILKVLDNIRDKISGEKEILIIYDFNDDKTIPVVLENINNYKPINIRLIKNDIAPGVVNALKKGFLNSGGKYTLAVMGDLSDDLINVDEMVQKMEEGYDIVCGSRYMKGGKHLGGNYFKKYLSKLSNITMHFFGRIPTYDTTNNFKMFRSSVLGDIKIESTGGFEIAMEITVKAFKKGYKITDVPTTWFERVDGKSNFKLWKWLPHYLKWYIYCIFKPRTLRT